MHPTLWSWPAGLLPQPVLANEAPFAEQDHRTVYDHRGVNALHVYDYRAEFRHGGRRWQIAPGSVAISPAGVPTSYHLPQAGRHWCVHFLPGEAPGQRLQLPVVMSLGAAASYVRERLARISVCLMRAGNDALHPARIAASAGLLELLAWLAAERRADGVHHQAERSYQAVEQAARLIRERPEAEIEAAALARTVGLSPNWLSRQFRQRFGVTIPRYRLEQRMNQARVLLAATALPVGEVGRRIGIPDPHHFNKLFRRITGSPPSASR